MEELHPSNAYQQRNPLGEAADVLASAADGLRQGLADPAFSAASQSAIAELSELAQAVAPNDTVRTRITAAGERLAEKVEHARFRIQHVAEQTKTRTDAIAESGRRAVQAPARVAHEVGQAAGSWLSATAVGAGLWAAAGTVAAIGLAVFTIGLVTGLNIALGAPWGAFVVTGLYAIGCALLVAAAKRSVTRGKEQGSLHLRQAREEVNRVGRPVSRAFKGKAGRHQTAPMGILIKTESGE